MDSGWHWEFVMTAKNPVGWFEIYVRDLSKAKAFYEAVLQVSLQPLEPAGDLPIEMLAFPMDMGGSGAAGALVRMEGAPRGPGGTMVYFMSEDCAVPAKRAAENGGQIVKAKMSIGQYGHIALAADLDGNIIGFHSMT
jgi:predicted enzyme related to lactoylglutathione lyase